MPRTPVIEIEQLRKFYKRKHRGIDGVDLEVYQGELFGFLGPNGAGKTTTIRILLDLIRADSGSARVFGLDIHNDSKEIRARTGYLPGELGFYERIISLALLPCPLKCTMSGLCLRIYLCISATLTAQCCLISKKSLNSACCNAWSIARISTQVH